MTAPFTPPLQAATVARSLPRLRSRLSGTRVPASDRYRPFRIAGERVGAVRKDLAEYLRAWPEVFALDATGIALVPGLLDCASRTQALDPVCRALAGNGVLSGWRDEPYRIAIAFDSPPLAHIERAAARFFGIQTWAAHANGLVATPSGIRMWFARRSPVKPIDPGMLDNLVGGGIASGSSVAETLLKECWEEAGIIRELAMQARAVGSADIHRDHARGLQAETVFMHDLLLPAAFVPANQDGEAVEHRLCGMDEAFELIAEPDTVTLDASLVALDCILRLGALDAFVEVRAELTALVAATPP